MIRILVVIHLQLFTTIGFGYEVLGTGVTLRVLMIAMSYGASYPRE